MREHLSPGATILLYGCDVAAGAPGEAFISALAGQSGCAVEASVDLTGASTLGGNWQLEATSGDSGVSPLALPDFSGVLASGFDDPALTWTRQFGSAGADYANAVAICSDGSVAAAGSMTENWNAAQIGRAHV